MLLAIENAAPSARFRTAEPEDTLGARLFGALVVAGRSRAFAMLAGSVTAVADETTNIRPSGRLTTLGAKLNIERFLLIMMPGHTSPHQGARGLTR